MGTPCNDYSKPRSCWCGNEYFLTNSETNEMMLYVISGVKNGTSGNCENNEDNKAIYIIKNKYKGIIKDIKYNSITNQVLTVHNRGSEHIVQEYT